MKGKASNLLNMRFGKLLVISKDPQKGNGIYWNCICDCGNTKIIRSSDLTKSNPTISCGCMAYASSKENIKKAQLASIKYSPADSTAKDIWSHCYNDGNISLSKFIELSQQNCFYCDNKPSNKSNTATKKSSLNRKIYGDFIYNGLDRINNFNNHNIDNVVTCCLTCNFSKSNMDINSFIYHIIKIFCWRSLIHDNKFCNIKYVVLSDQITYPQVSNTKNSNRKFLPQVSLARLIWHTRYKKEGLSFENFFEISQMDCIYCGSKPNNKYCPPSIGYDTPFIYNGIDRLNSDFSHIKTNIVPCCWNCNRMKRKQSLIQFDDWVTRIQNNILNIEKIIK